MRIPNADFCFFLGLSPHSFPTAPWASLESTRHAVLASPSVFYTSRRGTGWACRRRRGKGLNAMQGNGLGDASTGHLLGVREASTGSVTCQHKEEGHQLPAECLSDQSARLLGGLGVIPLERLRWSSHGPLAEDRSGGQQLPALPLAPRKANLLLVPRKALGQRCGPWRLVCMDTGRAMAGTPTDLQPLPWPGRRGRCPSLVADGNILTRLLPGHPFGPHPALPGDTPPSSLEQWKPTECLYPGWPEGEGWGSFPA